MTRYFCNAFLPTLVLRQTQPCKAVMYCYWGEKACIPEKTELGATARNSPGTLKGWNRTRSAEEDCRSSLVAERRPNMTQGRRSTQLLSTSKARNAAFIVLIYSGTYSNGYWPVGGIQYCSGVWTPGFRPLLSITQQNWGALSETRPVGTSNQDTLEEMNAPATSAKVVGDKGTVSGQKVVETLGRGKQIHQAYINMFTPSLGYTP